MKPRHLVTLFALACIAWSMTSCVTTTTTVTDPDGTVTVTKTTGPDAASVEAVTIAAQIIAEK
jgi:hypothetical protein